MFRRLFSLFLTIAVLFATPVFASDYSRAAFQKSGWKTRHKMTVRHHVLLERTLSKPLIYDNGHSRKVVLGTWKDQMTGLVYRALNPYGVLEIDHVIPLYWAWRHGADQWTYKKRNKFANDSRFLIITTKSVNASKSALGADLFLPVKQALACSYISTFQLGVIEYGLRLSLKESTLIASHEMDACRPGYSGS